MRLLQPQVPEFKLLLTAHQLKAKVKTICSHISYAYTSSQYIKTA